VLGAAELSGREDDEPGEYGEGPTPGEQQPLGGGGCLGPGGVDAGERRVS
jgi:hypothetical protein